MNSTVHRLYIILLFIIALTSAVSIGVKNADYYLLVEEERPFHPEYGVLKPSGLESHGYGMAGSAMIIIGVAMYSSRKRIKALRDVGRIKHFLEFHIFLCLLGPVLVLYHTTFKFGGIVAVSFWSMTAVVMSGIVGRYLYVQIPKGIQGNELDMKELEVTNDGLKKVLLEDYGLDEIDILKIDALASPKRHGSDSFFALLWFFITGDLMLRFRLHGVIRHLHGRAVDPAVSRKVVSLAAERIRLTRRILFLERLKHYFHYWHVIHLPFTIIMFVILLIHVGVAIAFGYTWIF